jgi:hypothetical protein
MSNANEGASHGPEGQPSQRKDWRTPRLQRLHAGGAEFGPQGDVPDGTFSSGPARAS